jgi:hypothetical protein
MYKVLYYNNLFKCQKVCSFRSTGLYVVIHQVPIPARSLSGAQIVKKIPRLLRNQKIDVHKSPRLNIKSHVSKWKLKAVWRTTHRHWAIRGVDYYHNKRHQWRNYWAAWVAKCQGRCGPLAPSLGTYNIKIYLSAKYDLQIFIYLLNYLLRFLYLIEMFNIFCH